MLVMSKKISKDKAKQLLSGGKEPEYSPSAPLSDAEKDTALEKGVYWYKQNFDVSLAKKWIEEYLKSCGRSGDCVYLPRAKKIDLTILSPYCRMALRGFPVSDATKKFIDRTIEEMIETSKKSKVVEEDVDKPNVQDRIKHKANEMLSTLEPVVDDVFDVTMSKKSSINPFLSWIKRSNLNKPMIEVALERLQTNLDEILLAWEKKDMDLVEGYSYLTAKNMKRVIAFFEEAIQSLKDASGVLKASRKPRKKKQKSVDQQVKNLNFMARNSEYGVDSVKPEAIIGSQAFIMFNEKNNKASVFVAVEAKDGLHIKGSTVVGYDEQKSFEKTVRKVEEFLKNLNGCRKTFSSAVRYLNGIKTKANVPTGRVNKHCLILQVQ